jgi:hypothetical protein
MGMSVVQREVFFAVFSLLSVWRVCLREVFVFAFRAVCACGRCFL